MRWKQNKIVQDQIGVARWRALNGRASCIELKSEKNQIKSEQSHKFYSGCHMHPNQDT